MALRKIGTSRDSALVATGEAPPSSWAAWETYPDWGTPVRGSGLSFPLGRYRFELLAGRIVPHVDGKNVSTPTSVVVLDGAVTLYGYSEASAIITRLA